jgi:hypothetical protein
VGEGQITPGLPDHRLHHHQKPAGSAEIEVTFGRHGISAGVCGLLYRISKKCGPRVFVGCSRRSAKTGLLCAIRGHDKWLRASSRAWSGQRFSCLRVRSQTATPPIRRKSTKRSPAAGSGLGTALGPQFHQAQSQPATAAGRIPGSVNARRRAWSIRKARHSRRLPCCGKVLLNPVLARHRTGTSSSSAVVAKSRPPSTYFLLHQPGTLYEGSIGEWARDLVLRMERGRTFLRRWDTGQPQISLSRS